MSQGRRGVVVVAEDNALVRHVMLKDLQSAGFTAIGYPDAAGALAYLAMGERIDALVTDISMPGDLDGLALAREASAARPRLSVVYVSASHPGDEHMLPEARFVPKPFRVGEVPDAVVERIEKARRAA